MLDHSWWVASHPIHPPGSVPGITLMSQPFFPIPTQSPNNNLSWYCDQQRIFLTPIDMCFQQITTTGAVCVMHAVHVCDRWVWFSNCLWWLLHCTIIDILTSGMGLEMEGCSHRSYSYISCLLNLWNCTPFCPLFLLHLAICCIQLFNTLVSYLVISANSSKCSNALLFQVLVVRVC